MEMRWLDVKFVKLSQSLGDFQERSDRVGFGSVLTCEIIRNLQEGG